MLTEKQIVILGKIRDYTNGSYDIFRFAGPYNKSTRQAIYSELCGEKKTRVQSGITAIENKLLEISGITGDCIANRNKNFKIWADSVLANVRPLLEVGMTENLADMAKDYKDKQNHITSL